MVGSDPDSRYHYRSGGLADYDAPPRRPPGVLIAAALAALGVLAAVIGVLVVFVFGDNGGNTPDPAATAETYLAAWQDNDIETMAEMVDEPPDTFADEHDLFEQSLRVEAAEHEVVDVEVEGDDAIAHFSTTMTLNSLGDWSYDGRLRLRRTGEDRAWQVDWTPAALHPDQTDEARLTLVSQWPERGNVTDPIGQPLVSAQPAQLVAIIPELMDDIDDRDEIKDALAEHLDVPPEAIDAALDAPGVQPDHLVPIITIPEQRHAEVVDDLFPVPGVAFRERTLRMGPTEEFARHILGRTGEITAERLDELGPPYTIGDTVGLTGMERRFERELAGTPSGELRLIARDEADDIEPEVVDTIEGIEPVDIRTTLDPSIQLAVEQAISDIDKPVGVVVVDSEGRIQATASRPLDEFNRALEGTYPPGSTFKIVTTEGLLADGITPDTELDCHETVNAGGRVFTNFEDAELGTVPFSTVFAQSCNTAFIGAGADLSGPDFVAAAERFGFNTEYSIGIPSNGGQFPEPVDTTEQAAATIGQGRIIASPLHMATVGATVIDGTWTPPSLLIDPPEGDTDAPDDEAPQPQSLTPGAAATILDLMELVVTEGSGDAAAVPGARIFGKTGTAEFDVGDPPPTHAWFVGIRGDLALAIVIEDGGVGGRDAAPVAGEILARLPD